MIAETVAQEGEGLAPYKWADNVLTFRISDDFTAGQRAAIIQAGTEWGKAAGITWVYADDPVIWVRPGERPETYLPNNTELGGDIFLQNPEAPTGFDLFNTLHEIGHALGLVHNNDKSVMNVGLAYLPFIRPTEPTAIDIERVQDMYSEIGLVGIGDSFG